MKRVYVFLIAFVVIIQTLSNSQVTTYSTLSTGYSRIWNFLPSAPATPTDISYYNSNWYIYQRQDLVYSPPDFYPAPGSPTVINTEAIVIYPGSMLTDINANYINYDSTYATTDPYFLTYRTYFNLPAFLTTNKRYSMVLKMRGDDVVFDVRLNGTVIVGDTTLYKDSLGNILGGAFSGDYSEVLIPYCDANFKQGQNYLDITCVDVVAGTSAMAAEVILYQRISDTELCPVVLPSTPCEDCIGSFSPIPGKKYLISGWVKEDGATQSKTSYTYPSLTVKYPSLTDSSGPFFGSGDIIDGWQRIEGEFLIPALATDLNIKLECSSGDCYFDDIRVFPFDGSMKSYVYDPVTMRLSAELDERNYATLYEYDEEGKLVRVKKETQKGIMTIKENRNNTKKQ